MPNVVKINSRNDIHLPKEVLEAVNLGDERMVSIEARGNCIILLPVDVEPRYSPKALEGLDRLVAREKDQAIEVKSEKEIRSIFKKSRSK